MDIIPYPYLIPDSGVANLLLVKEAPDACLGIYIYPAMGSQRIQTSNGSWCIGIKG